MTLSHEQIHSLASHQVFENRRYQSLIEFQCLVRTPKALCGRIYRRKTQKVLRSVSMQDASNLNSCAFLVHLVE